MPVGDMTNIEGLKRTENLVNTIVDPIWLLLVRASRQVGIKDTEITLYLFHNQIPTSCEPCFKTFFLYEAFVCVCCVYVWGGGLLDLMCSLYT